MTCTPDTPERSLAAAAPLFAALGDDTRLKILARLSEAGPLSISGLARGATVSRQAITKHLHSLAKAGLACGERNGRQSLWRLQPLKLSEAQAYLSQISAQWDAALGRLAAHVERDES